MFISDRPEMCRYADGMLLDAKISFAAAAFCALFGGIYEYFSHEVYSGYMIFAFAIPLFLGAFPALGAARYVKKKAEKERTKFTDIKTPVCDKMDNTMAEDNDGEAEGICVPGRISRNAWNSGIAALTVGCVFRGVLEIYGTTNRLLVVYPAIAAILLCVGAAAFIVPLITVQRMNAQRMKQKAQK